MNCETFSGAKIALVCGEELVAYKRDRKPDIPFPDLWDLPGGQREGVESPEACVIREVQEEFGLALSAREFVWSRRYPPGPITRSDTYFFVSHIDRDRVASIRFGEEGQCWAMMTLDRFLNDDAVIPHLQQRLSQYLNAI